MNLKTRIDRLLAAATALHEARRRVARRLMCRGMSWERVLEAVQGATSPDDEDVVARIMGHVEARAATPLVKDPRTGEPERDETGNVVYEVHHFVWWLMGLQHGS